jgi:O-antigen/teichoic acid export membrane protein
MLTRTSEIVPGPLKDVPEHQRRRMVLGMRWTVWLSALAIPFSYGTPILLARTSPEAIGTYGLLSVYIGVVLGLFYLGGDAVAIKFIPELDSQKRLSFLVSYFLVVCLAVLPWLVAARVWRGGLHYVLGGQASESFELLLLILSPLSILFSLVGAALKGILEIAWAQIINRLITIGSFLVYAALFLAFRTVLAHSYTQVIWATYLALCAIGSLVGIERLLQFNGLPCAWRSLRFFLPKGFWPYTLSLQQLSALTFFTQRLDAILILNFGNLALLGEYVAIVTLAESIRLIGKFFLDTLLPSLTNLIAAGNVKGASDVFKLHMRILFLVNAASTCALIFLAGPIVTLLGPKYIQLTPLVVPLACAVGLFTPGGVGGIVLSSIGRQQRGVFVALGHIGIYAVLFLWLWAKWQLLGAVLAYGIAWLISNSLYLAIAKLSCPFSMPIGRDYFVWTLVAVCASLFAKTHELGLSSGLLACVAAISVFIILAQYSVGECKQIIDFFVPRSFIGRLRSGRSKTSSLS